MRTFENVFLRIPLTYFALMPTMHESPISMSAVVAFSQFSDGWLCLCILCSPVLSRISSGNLVRSGDEAVFVPLSTGTGLPTKTADIAALVSTLCSDSWGKGQYQNWAPQGQLQGMSVNI